MVVVCYSRDVKLHPLVEIILDAIARPLRVDPSLFHDAASGRPVPEWFADLLVETYGPRLKRSDLRTTPLTSQTDASTIRTMRTREIDVSEPRIGRPLKSTGHNKGGAKLLAALKKARITLAEEAKAVKRTPTALRFHCAPEDSGNFRPPPRELAERWEREYHVPVGDWPRLRD